MSTFVQRFAARVAAWICTAKGHDFTRWKTVHGAGPRVIDPSPVPSLVIGKVTPHDGARLMANYGKRKCKRCGSVEIGAAPKKRKPHAADTVQGMNREQA